MVIAPAGQSIGYFYRVDYGVLYGSASETNLKTLDSITNEALRIAYGAFKTTPVKSIYIICNEMPPNIRRNYLSVI